MKRAVRILNSERGVALITAVMVMMIVSVMGLAYLTLVSSNLIRANRDKNRSTAFYLAEAGVEYVVSDIMDQAATNGGTVASRTVDTTAVMNSLVTGSTGSVTVTSAGSPSSVGTIVSSATYNGITQRVKVQLSVKDVSVWNNAIFAGMGQAGMGINGNVDIRGSVHILGDGEPYSDLNGNGKWDTAESFTDKNGNGVYDSGEPFTDTDGNGLWSAAEPYIDNNGSGSYDPPLTAQELATDLSGSANIGNTYSGMPADLAAKIPGLVAQQVGSETITTLNAEVRVKHGTLNVSGTALVGSANVGGDSDKETVDGVYVTDGYGGNKGTASIYSDNGTANKYDLGNRVPFPSLLSPYKDPSTGLTYSSYESYLNANSLSVPSSITTISSATPSFAYAGPGGSISWNQLTNTLTVTGIVRFPGDIDMSSKGSTIYYSGKGTIFGKNDIRVHGSVMPLTMFPTVDCMGVIAKHDIQFATGSGEAQLSGMGAWFAQNKIVSAKQNQFAGTYVANYFDMGTNVPSIYQVPTLINNLPPGMPGKERIFVAHVKSWRHL